MFTRAKRVLAVILALSTLSGVWACSRTFGSTPTPNAIADVRAPTEVRIAHLATGAITRSVTLPAQVLPDKQVTLHAKVSGYLQKIGVDKGDSVKPGMMLA